MFKMTVMLCKFKTYRLRRLCKIRKVKEIRYFRRTEEVKLIIIGKVTLLRPSTCKIQTT